MERVERWSEGLGSVASEARDFCFHHPPSLLPVTRLPTMAMRDELTAILAAAEVPKEFTEYLVSKGLFQVDQLALMASDENRLEDKTSSQSSRLPASRWTIDDADFREEGVELGKNSDGYLDEGSHWYNDRN